MKKSGGTLSRRRPKPPSCRRRLSVESCEPRRLLAVDHVVLISVDGLAGPMLEQMLAAEQQQPTGNYASFLRLQREGASTMNARTDVTHTNTLPNHTSMLTGRPVLPPTSQDTSSHHNWTANVDPPAGATLHSNHPTEPYIASVFDIVHDQGLSTGMFASKTKFSLFDVSYNAVHGASDATSQGGDNGRDKIDRTVLQLDTDRLVDDLVAALNRDRLNFSFLHLADPDEDGHHYGWGSGEWQASVQHVDQLIGRVFNAIEQHDQLRGRTAIIVTSDHGGARHDHSNANLLANYQIPFFVWGPEVAAGQNLYAVYSATVEDPGVSRPSYSQTPPPIRNGDAGNLALDLLGLPPIPDSMMVSLHSCAQDTQQGCSGVGGGARFDWGDAPISYPTREAENGARHLIVPGFHLGRLADPEVDGQPDSSALGDDLSVDDEDGVTLMSTLQVGTTARVQVTASQVGVLQGWFDWNQDGDWDDRNEQAFRDAVLLPGSNELAVVVPDDAMAGSVVSRFRFSLERGLSATGVANSGEVEDYRFDVMEAPQPTGPDARDDFYQVIVGGGVYSLPVTANDSGTGRVVVSSVGVGSRGGLVSISGDQRTVRYEPVNGMTGRETFSYTIQDDTGLTDTATVQVQVNPLPVAQQSVRVRLNVSTDDSNSVNSVAMGDRFWIEVYVQDVRAAGAGVASAYLNVKLSGATVRADGEIEFGPSFQADTDGRLVGDTIRNVGGRYRGGSSSTAEQLLFRVPVRGTTVGPLRLTVHAADSPAHVVRLIGASGLVPFANWRTNEVEIELTDPRPDVNPLDVDRNGIVTPLDALLIINDLNRFGGGRVSDRVGPSVDHLDVNRDGFITPLDALLVINELNDE